MHKAEYRLTPAAEGDLEAIWRYTAGQWGMEQANRYIDIITATLPSWPSARKQPRPVMISVPDIDAAVSSDT